MHLKEIVIGVCAIALTVGVYLIGCGRGDSTAAKQAAVPKAEGPKVGIQSFRRESAGEWIWEVELEESVGRDGQFQILLLSDVEPGSDRVLDEELRRRVVFRAEQTKASSVANLHFRLEVQTLDGQRAAMRHGAPAVLLKYRLVILSGAGGFSFGETKVPGDLIVRSEFSRSGDLVDGELQLGEFVTQDLSGKYFHRLIVHRKKDSLAAL